MATPTKLSPQVDDAVASDGTANDTTAPTNGEPPAMSAADGALTPADGNTPPNASDTSPNNGTAPSSGLNSTTWIALACTIVVLILGLFIAKRYRA